MGNEEKEIVITDAELIKLFSRYYKLNEEYNKYLLTVIETTPFYNIPSMLEWFNTIKEKKE